MRHLAIDYGLRRVGLALCDPDEIIVSPLTVLRNDPGRPSGAIQQIGDIVVENKVDAIVLGLPLNMDNTEGEQARQTRVFGEQLSRLVDVPLFYQDERLSSAAADEMMNGVGLTTKQRKEKRDMLAACAILQDYLDIRKGSS
jgi:putative Holliday junction resolvase